MPLMTFLNLKKSRQKEIIDVCLEEFTSNDYAKASINRIIKKLGIAKGSFYRYFENKEDLYRYLVEYGKKLNIDLFNKVFEEDIENYQDIFDGWVNFYLAAIRLDNQYPLYSYFGYKFSQERDNQIFGDIVLKGRAMGIKLLKDKFRQQQNKGSIRKDLDLDMMIFTLLQIQSGFLDYLSIKYGIDFKENVTKKNSLFTLPEEKIKEELEAFAKVLREGMGRH